MGEKHSRGWVRIGGDVLRLLQSLVTVEDAPAEAQRPESVPINPATGLRMLGGVGGVDTSGHTFGQGFSTPRTQKR
jgi:hypothetical protein